MAAPLVTRTNDVDIIPASDHNDVKSYIEDGTYRVNTLALEIQDSEVIDQNKNSSLVSYYGSMYVDEANATIAISSQSTYTPMTGDLLAGSSNGFTFQNSSELLCVKAGKYLINWHSSIQVTGAGIEVAGGIMINSTAQLNTTNHQTLVNTNTHASIGGTGIITLAADDVVKIAFNNHSGTQDITLEHLNMTLIRVND